MYDQKILVLQVYKIDRRVPSNVPDDEGKQLPKQLKWLVKPYNNNNNKINGRTVFEQMQTDVKDIPG